MNPFSEDFTLFGDDSDNENPAVPSVMTDRDDTGVLENLRKTLAMRYTTYFRYESLAETNILYDSQSRKTKIIQDVFAVTQEILENAKETIRGHELVQMHDQVNAYRTISRLAMNDGLYCSMQIAANDPEDRDTKAPTYWKTIFNVAHASCMVNWKPNIADIETKDQRDYRQKRQAKGLQAAAKAREEWEDRQRGDLNKRFHEDVIECTEAELPELLARERTRRVRQYAVELKQMTDKARSMAEGRGERIEAYNPGFVSEAESTKTVTEPKMKKKTAAKKPMTEGQKDPKVVRGDNEPEQKPSFTDRKKMPKPPNDDIADAIHGRHTKISNTKGTTGSTSSGPACSQSPAPAQPHAYGPGPGAVPHRSKPNPAPATLPDDEDKKKGGKKKKKF